MELWYCPDMDSSQKMAILAGHAMQDREQKLSQDDFGKTIKGRLNIQEALARLFRDWARDHQIRFTDLWGNVAPKGADSHAVSITVPVKEGRHYTIKDLQNACVVYFEKDPLFRKGKEEYTHNNIKYKFIYE